MISTSSKGWVVKCLKKNDYKRFLKLNYSYMFVTTADIDNNGDKYFVVMLYLKKLLNLNQAKKLFEDLKYYPIRYDKYSSVKFTYKHCIRKEFGTEPVIKKIQNRIHLDIDYEINRFECSFVFDDSLDLNCDYGFADKVFYMYGDSCKNIKYIKSLLKLCDEDEFSNITFCDDTWCSGDCSIGVYSNLKPNDITINNFIDLITFKNNLCKHSIIVITSVYQVETIFRYMDQKHYDIIKNNVKFTR